ncbi:MAG TPA: hypothetical protein VEH09_12590, partial [Thermodesulfobacteriota bacterium]|nr:hypothetical protein [Thermodesulfobacteriota bacterium]
MAKENVSIIRYEIREGYGDSWIPTGAGNDLRKEPFVRYLLLFNKVVLPIFILEHVSRHSRITLIVKTNL